MALAAEVISRRTVEDQFTRTFTLFFAKKNREKKPLRPLKSVFSVAFIVSIPANIILALLLCSGFFLLVSLDSEDLQSLQAFVVGIILAASVLYSVSARKTRIFVHELKHLVVARLSGVSVKAMNISDNGGSVNLQYHREQERFMPFVFLAPYYFPLFSLPLFCGAIFLQRDYRIFLAFGLGFLFTVDLVGGLRELHLAQTDLHGVPGRSIGSLLFISTFLLMWGLNCVLWVMGGNDIYLTVLSFLFHLLTSG